MRLVCSDGKLEGQVVAYIRRVSTVLQFATIMTQPVSASYESSTLMT